MSNCYRLMCCNSDSASTSSPSTYCFHVTRDIDLAGNMMDVLFDSTTIPSMRAAWDEKREEVGASFSAKGCCFVFPFNENVVVHKNRYDSYRTILCFPPFIVYPPSILATIHHVAWAGYQSIADDDIMACPRGLSIRTLTRGFHCPAQTSLSRSHGSCWGSLVRTEAYYFTNQTQYLHHRPIDLRADTRQLKAKIILSWPHHAVGIPENGATATHNRNSIARQQHDDTCFYLTKEGARS
jgi:hypothetical protein